MADATRGEIRIGYPGSLAAGFVPAIVDRLTHLHPEISVHVVVAQPGEQQFHELRERSVDLLLGRVFRPLSVDDVTMEVLCQDAFFVVAGEGCRFRAHGLLLRRSLRSFSMQMRLHLLATGRFLTVLHGSVLRFNAEA